MQEQVRRRGLRRLDLRGGTSGPPLESRSHIMATLRPTRRVPSERGHAAQTIVAHWRTGKLATG